MKSLLFFVAACIMSVAFMTSCNAKGSDVTVENDSIEVVDTLNVDTVMVDTLAVDTTAVAE